MAEVIELVQRGGQQRGVVPAGGARILVAEQVQSAIDSCDQPNRRARMSFLKTILSAIRGRGSPADHAHPREL